MKDSQLQTSQRDPSSANRRTKSTPDVKRNLNKVTRKSSVPELMKVLEESPKKVSDQNPITKPDENSLAMVNPDPVIITSPVTLASPSSTITHEKHVSLDQNPITKSDDNSLAKVNPDPLIITSPGTSVISDLTSPSSTHGKNVILDASEADSYNIETIEVEMVMNCLREARSRVLKSKNLGYSRKLLDALISVVVEEYCVGVCEEKKWIDKLLSSKFNLVFMTFMHCVLVIFVVWIFNQGAESLITGPPPT